MRLLLGLAILLSVGTRLAAAQAPPDSLAAADEWAATSSVAPSAAVSVRLAWAAVPGDVAPGDAALDGDADPRRIAWNAPDADVFADTTGSPLDTLQMSRWERLLWGRRGLTRRLGLFPTHPDAPTDDLRQIAHVRRRMLGLHQTLGLVTVASMAATVIGGQIAVSGGGSGFHRATLPVTIGLYSTTAALAILSPPKLVSFEGHRIDSITIHRWLAIGHVAGMILTPLLAPSSVDDARIHQISGYATFATFSAAMLVVTLLRR